MIIVITSLSTTRIVTDLAIALSDHSLLQAVIGHHLVPKGLKECVTLEERELGVVRQAWQWAGV